MPIISPENCVKVIKGKSPVVYSSPHIGTGIPPRVKLQIKSRFKDKKALAESMIDHGIDAILAESTTDDISQVIALFSEIVADTNRPDTDYDLDKYNIGEKEWDRVYRIVPLRTDSGADLWRWWPPIKKKELDYRKQFRAEYHKQLGSKCDDIRTEFGYYFHVDWHSTPRAMQWDLVLGDCRGQSCGTYYIHEIIDFFKQLGLWAGHYGPAPIRRNGSGWGDAEKSYVGGYTVNALGQAGNGRHSMQIEVSRELFQDRETGEIFYERKSEKQIGMTEVLRIFQRFSDFLCEQCSYDKPFNHD